MKGRKVVLDITDAGMDGEGVARLGGLAVFVGGVLTGETVEAIITQQKKNFARAKVIKVTKRSSFRREPACPVYFNCGGCNMQHIAYGEQLRIKKNELVNCLRKQLKREIEVDDVVPSKSEFHYRNKLQIPIGEREGRIVAGFYMDRTHRIVPTDSCFLQGEWADRIIGAFLDYANSNSLTAYDEISHKGLLRHLYARKIGEKYSVVVVINGKELPESGDLIERLKGLFQDDFSLHISINRKRTNVIMGDRLELLYGNDRIETDILGLKVLVSPLSFMQVNNYIRDLIYMKVARMVEADGIVIDAYSGAGVLTALASRNAKLSIGIEIVPEAVRDADTLMAENGLDHNVINLLGDIKDILPKVVKALQSAKSESGIISAINSAFCIGDNNRCFQGKSNCSENDDDADSLIRSDNLRSNNEKNSSANKAMEAFQTAQNFDTTTDLSDKITIILDPPRKGCVPEVLETILSVRPKNIIYISCNPATLARDLAALSPNYSITSITPYDMFPNTSHLETLVCLIKKS